MSLRASLSFKRPQSFPVSSLCIVLVFQDVGSQLRLQRHAYLPVATLPAIVVMDSNSLNL